MNPEFCKYRTPNGYCKADPDDLDICEATEQSTCCEPMTNFDRIHKMSQEEFVKWFVNLDSICEYCSHCGDEHCGARYCEKELNEFLSQEYKGGF